MPFGARLGSRAVREHGGEVSRVVSFVRVASLECTAEFAIIGLLLCVAFLHPCRAGRSAPPRPFGAEVVPSGGARRSQEGAVRVAILAALIDSSNHMVCHPAPLHIAECWIRGGVECFGSSTVE